MSRTRGSRQAKQISIPRHEEGLELQINNLQRLENVLVAVCCLIAALSFVRTLQFGFVYDDHSQVVQNPQVQSWGYLGRLLLTEVWSQRGTEHVGTYYRPLFSLWLLIVHTVW